MNILLIHQSFVSPAESGGTRHYEFARHLIYQGHQVTIVASSLSYLTGQKMTSGRRLVTEHFLDGIRILRAATMPTLHRSFVWRTVSFLSFMLTSIIASLKAGKCDIVISTSPPIFQGISGWIVACLRRRPYLLEIRDLWPEFAIDMGVLTNPMLISFSRMLEGFLYSRAATIIVNSPAYVDYLMAHEIPKSKVALIPNGVDPTMFVTDSDGSSMRKYLKLENKFIVTYAGALGLANNIELVLEAACRLRGDPVIHFLIAGDGKERQHLEFMAHDMALDNITFIGSYPKTEIPKVLAASDACLAVLQNIPMFRTTFPNKVFDYMAAARPTVLVIDGVIRQVLEAANGGIYVPPGNVDALADAVRYLKTHRAEAVAMGQAAQAYVAKHFNRADHAVLFNDLIERSMDHSE